MKAALGFALLILLCRCTSQNDQPVSDLNIERRDSIRFLFQNPSYALFDGSIGSTLLNNNAAWYYLSQEDSSLYIRTLQGDSELTVPLGRILKNFNGWNESSPPEYSVEDVNHIYISDHSSDTIWVVSGELNLIIDTIILKWPESFENLSLYRERISPTSPLIRNRNSYYLPISVSELNNTSTEILPEHYPLLAEFTRMSNDLNITRVLGQLPASYYESPQYFVNSTYLQKGDTIILSPYFSDSILVLTLGQNNYQSIGSIARSNFSNGFKQSSGASFDINSMNILYFVNPRYSAFVYDASHNVYFRSFIHSGSVNKETGQIVPHSKWSLLMLDSNFNLIGEKVFNTSDYAPHILLCSPQGLYLRKSSKQRGEIYFQRWTW